MSKYRFSIDCKLISSELGGRFNELKGFNLPYPGSSNTVIDHNRNIYSVISKKKHFIRIAVKIYKVCCYRYDYSLFDHNMLSAQLIRIIGLVILLSYLNFDIVI